MLYIPCQKTNEWPYSKYLLRAREILQKIPKETQRGLIYKPYFYWKQTSFMLCKLKSQVSKQSIKPQTDSSWCQNWRMYTATAHKTSHWSWPWWKYGSFLCVSSIKVHLFIWNVPLCESAARGVRVSLFPCESRSRLVLLPRLHAQHC